MSRFRSAYRGIDKAFRDALRVKDIDTWLNLWRSYGKCTECQQEAGRPCLDLTTKTTTLHLADPHEGRPSAPTEHP